MNNVNSIANDIYEILEELYDSANAISEERINRCAESLCQSLNIDPELIENGLCVRHWKDRR